MRNMTRLLGLLESATIIATQIRFHPILKRPTLKALVWISWASSFYTQYGPKWVGQSSMGRIPIEPVVYVVIGSIHLSTSYSKYIFLLKFHFQLKWRSESFPLKACSCLTCVSNKMEHYALSNNFGIKPKFFLSQILNRHR